MNENTRKIISLYDGKLTSIDVAKIVGVGSRYVRKVAKKYNLERLHCGARFGEDNHQYVSGRRIDLDGYVLVTAPLGHPYARKISNRLGCIMFEHRLVMEKHLGRYLLPTEVVDHKNGLTLHNDPENLRVFQKNGDHLHETISGIPKNISVSGRRNIELRYHPDTNRTPVDIYYLRRERGDVRLLQILHAALKFGIDSPFLLGTHYHLEKKQIDWIYRPNLEQALNGLLQRWEQDLLM
jgi:hypothetical protein